MSVQFGRWNFDGSAALPSFIEGVNAILAPYGPDAVSVYQQQSLSMIFAAFHTTSESRVEIQPHTTPSGTVIVWDGRLDNRAELLSHFHSLSNDSTDLAIVATSHERWGNDCFSKLIGDWAVSIWNPNERSLILAKDCIGTRHLYYQIEKDRICWSTVLDPLVRFANKSFALDEEYAAGWLASFPATHLTPYVGIRSVPPSCFVRLKDGVHSVHKYWNFNPRNKLRYRTDAEYEEHFRSAFSAAVSRRLRSDTPILAELSGGMDSCSIVCMADRLMRGEILGAPRLDTLSYYDDSEPTWDERPYFAKVEEQLGRTGCHIDVGMQQATSERGFALFAATPGSSRADATEASRRFASCLATQRNRVVLSGIGGDEVTGGVPTPQAELMDLLADFRFRELAKQLKLWALNQRRPWFHLFFEAAREFLPVALAAGPKYRIGWLQDSFAVRQKDALTGYRSKLSFFGPPPSHQHNLATLEGLRRQMACTPPTAVPPYEKRYPFLDRELLEFIFAVPRSQIVRPGQRRSLMRRALANIVPQKILDRKRKAFIARTPAAMLSREWSRLVGEGRQLQCSLLGIVDARKFADAIERARRGDPIPIVPLLRTLSLESWLRNVERCGVMRGQNCASEPSCEALIAGNERGRRH